MEDPFRDMQRTIFLGVVRQIAAMTAMGAVLGLVLTWLHYRGMPVNLLLSGLIFCLYGAVLLFLTLRLLVPALIVMASHPLAPMEFTPQRLQVWKLLSELYLDTEHDDVALERIAAQLKPLGFSARELRDIFECEISPACIVNLYAVAGAWAGFDEDWLVQRTSRLGPAYHRIAKIPGYGPWLIRQITSSAREEFEKILKNSALSTA